ncbi:MAG: hypothetical protein LQ345_006217, partial [Seirophora villosa]
MATSTRDQYRQQPQARNAENIRPQQTESRREYDRFHPGHSPRVSAVAPDLPNFSTGMPSSGFRDYHEDRRHSSPVRAPVHQMPLSNGMNHGPGRQSYGIRDHDLDQHKPYPRPHREHRDVPNPRIQSRPGSVSQTFPKRPASSSYPIAEHESAPKRQRQMPAEASRPTTVHSSSGRPRQPADITGEQIHAQTGTKEASVTALRIVYVNASTQTKNIQIQSSKLALLQEEEFIAQTKHASEMKRRKQALDLELEHERRVLELRHRFEMPTVVPSGRLDQAGSLVNSAPSAETVEALQAQIHASVGTAERNGMSPVKEEVQVAEQPANAAQELRIMGASRHSSISRQESREPGIIDEARPTAADPSSILNRLMGSPPVPDHQDRANATQKSLG